MYRLSCTRSQSLHHPLTREICALIEIFTSMRLAGFAITNSFSHTSRKVHRIKISKRYSLWTESTFARSLSIFRRSFSGIPACVYRSERNFITRINSGHLAISNLHNSPLPPFFCLPLLSFSMPHDYFLQRKSSNYIRNSGRVGCAKVRRRAKKIVKSTICASLPNEITKIRVTGWTLADLHFH